MGAKLFDGSDDDVEEISKIEVNKEFAKRYQHNKEREDLQRYEELKKKGLVDGSTSSESESLDEEIDSAGEQDEVVDFFDKLAKVKAGDPALKDKDYRLFDYSDGDSDEDEGKEGRKGESGNKREKKEKKKYLKDVNAERLMELGPEFGGQDDDEEEDEDEDEKVDVKKVKSYSEEQEELRKEFLNAVEEAEGEDGDEGGLLTVKSKDDEEEEEEGTVEVKEKLDQYFGKDEQLDEKDLYLKKFFENRLWIDKEKGKKPTIDEDEIPVSDDEEEIVRQEDYEREFNFRFEEGAGDRVQSHSRTVDDSVRKKNATRKEQRKRKKERMEQAELERQEEVKRLKNLKKKEIMEKINKIKLVAGLSDGLDIPLTEADLEEEFDPEKYDKQMKDAFGKQYYDAEDVDSDFGSDKEEGDLEKPDFEKEDELLGLPKDWDVVKPGSGFSSERKKYLETPGKSEGDEEEEKEEGLNGEADEEQPVESKRKRKRKMSLKEKITLDEDLEELYKLDYEDTIGDLKTRFKYKEVAPKRYGLSAEEILALDDKELNQVVSVKKLAPYREKEWKVPHTKLMAVKKKMKEQEPFERRSGKDEGKHKKRKDKEHARYAAEDGDNLEGMSRKEKRKHRKAELKISESRLMAYGKIPSKSKGKSQD